MELKVEYGNLPPRAEDIPEEVMRTLAMSLMRAYHESKEGGTHGEFKQTATDGL